MSKTFQHLHYTSDFQSLPDAFYRRVNPQALQNPELVVASDACADIIGLDPGTLSHDDSLQLLSGQAMLSAWQPIAMKYTGHQFGYYNPDLGDGRGLLLAEVRTEQGNLLDLHLKGAGMTPYSREGDGRAVLRSSIREFLCSEALAALGVPTTRALCVINTDTPVYREQVETGVTLLRVSASHIRFGHFEYAYHSQQPALLQALCDYVAQRHYPCLAGSANQNADLFELTARKTGELIAQWQLLGFAHGVMNTDNMSILGETFDFGPFGFMDRFNPGYICNHSDHGGRYGFDQQPAIAHWNLSVLAQAMSPVVDKEALHQGLRAYSEAFNQHFIHGLNLMLGFAEDDTLPQEFTLGTFTLMQQNGLDYSYFFRRLIQVNESEVETELRDHCVDRDSFDTWLSEYRALHDTKEHDEATRQQRMRAVNPKYILRNHLAQIAIEKAQQGDYSDVRRLHNILKRPFDEQPENEAYAALPPDWAESLEISCSS